MEGPGLIIPIFRNVVDLTSIATCTTMRRDKERNRRSSSSYDSLGTPPSETMSSWFERQAANHQVQLAATAVLSGIAVAGIIYGSQAARRKVAVDELKASIPELSEKHHAQTVGSKNRTFIRRTWSRSIVSLTDRLSEAYKLWVCRTCRSH